MTQDLAASQLLSKLRHFIKAGAMKDHRARIAVDAASNALQQRNRVLHGAMSGHFDPDTAALNNRRKMEVTSISGDELTAVAEQLFDAAMIVSEVHWDSTPAEGGDSNDD
ncbi:hypothetical protein [Brachybacterium paraconglomeratum]|uniref:hypothetical protein n=1 Tax=Brachybacterium paraconglomeratum TaxID=173362 RepID=UPI00223BF5A6|nr:hypothetical protein [Brachybacterium paraconglomeratum]MCT1438624.1 hypothetical protein [Brachybacterium paraconglomeratum]